VPLQTVSVAGEILEQVNRDIETDDKRFILIRKDLLEKGTSDFFFHVQDIALAAARIDHHANRQGKVRFGSKVLDGLGLTVLEDVEVCLCEVRDQGAVLVLHIEKKLDYVDIDLQSFGGILISGLLRRPWLRRLLSHGKGGGEQESGQK
jgi:hypothetical protein